MAIGTDDAIDKFGTQDSLDSTSGSVADGAFSVAGDLIDFTNDDDAREASIVLECTFPVAPDASSTVALFARPANLVSTSGQLDPSADFQHVFMGSFPVKPVTTAQFISIPLDFNNNKTSQIYRYFTQNNTGQTMSAGWDLHPTPKAVGPHP